MDDSPDVTAARSLPSRIRLPAPLWVTFGIGISFLLGLVQALPHTINRGSEWRLFGPSAVAVVLASLAFARRLHVRPIQPGVVLLVAPALALLLAYSSAAVWPNSGDEYGYLYAARTMLEGRLYNPAPPIPDLFSFNWIGIHDGRMASQYTPGWPLFLVPFQAAHLAPLANPLLLVALGGLLLACLKLLGSPTVARASLLSLTLLAPFTLFNAASLFNHMLASVAVLGTCWCALRDERQSSVWNCVGVGAFLSLILITRMEVGFVTAVMLGIDQLLTRRLKALRNACPIIAGALPLVLICLCYNAAITGNPFFTTMAWATPTAATLATPTIHRFIDLQSANIVGLLSFTSVTFLLLYVVALWTKLRTRALRFYDLLLPALALFFVFYPQDPGHQYGPRYWFAAWPVVALTVGSAWPERQGIAYLAGWRIHLPTLALLQCCSYFSFMILFAVFLRMYVDTRLVVYKAVPPVTPAVILIPNRRVFLTSWQRTPFYFGAGDFTRNDFRFSAAILYARGDRPDAVRLACTLVDRHVFVWREPGTLLPAPCQPM